MTLASRLAEDRDVTIAVLEAGGDMHTHDSIRMLITPFAECTAYSRIFQLCPPSTDGSMVIPSCVIRTLIETRLMLNELISFVLTSC